MTDFGKRLKEERERLGFSQAKFGEACGVGRTAQFNYERGEREPSWSYMEAAERLGVDTLYVISGTKKGEDWAYARAYKHMLHTIEMLLGLEDGGRLEHIARMAIEAEARIAEPRPGEIVTTEAYNLAVLDWLKTSQRPDFLLDLDLLATVLAEIDGAVSEPTSDRTAVKRAKAAAILYRAFKASGKVDAALVRDTLALATE